MTRRLITANELLAAPTGIDWASIAEDGVSGEAAIEQSNLLDAASDWIANEVEQPLGLHATTQQEQAILYRAKVWGAKAYFTRDGALRFRTDTFPICSVTSMQWGYLPTPIGYTPLTVANLIIDGSYPKVQVIEDWSLSWGDVAQGALTPDTSSTGGPAMVQATYVSGWPNAILQAGVSAGSSVALQVDSTLGMATAPYFSGQDNSTLTIYDQAKTEVVQVSSIADATHLVVASLANSHSAGARISSMPRDIRQATIYACIEIARERGVDVIAMQDSSGGGRVQQMVEEAADRARLLLNPYLRRI